MLKLSSLLQTITAQGSNPETALPTFQIMTNQVKTQTLLSLMQSLTAKLDKQFKMQLSVIWHVKKGNEKHCNGNDKGDTKHVNSQECNLFIYLGFYVAFNTVQVISRRVVGRAEETSTYSSLGFCIVNCRPMVSNYQLSHLRPCRESNPGLRGGRRECYHSATVAPPRNVRFLI